MNRLIPPTLCARGLDTKNKILKRDQMKSILQFSIRKAPDFVTFKTLLYLFLYFFSSRKHYIVSCRRAIIRSFLCAENNVRDAVRCVAKAGGRDKAKPSMISLQICVLTAHLTRLTHETGSTNLYEHRNARVDTKNAKSSKRATITMRN